MKTRGSYTVTLSGNSATVGFITDTNHLEVSGINYLGGTGAFYVDNGWNGFVTQTSLALNATARRIDRGARGREPDLNRNFIELTCCE